MPEESYIPTPFKPGFRWMHFIVDVLLVNIAFHLAFLLRFRMMVFDENTMTTGAPIGLYWWFELVITIGWIVLSLFLRLYSPRIRGRKLSEVSLVLRALGLLAGVALVVIVSKGGYNYYSRIFLISFFSLSALALILSHIVTLPGILFTQQMRDVLIIGAGRAGERFYHNVSHDPSIGYHVVGFLDDNAEESNVSKMILGRVSDISRITDEQKIDEVIIALPKTDERELAELVETCENKLIRVNVIPNDYDALEGKRVVERIGEFSVVRMREAPLDDPMNKTIKRAFDILFSLIILLIVFPPVFVICGILIKLSSRGPIFFKQLRRGEIGNSFTCYKFRTMRNQSRESSDSLQTSPNDPRLTFIGRFLRRTNLDELPQFWNVLGGEMSVVGPRPHMIGLSDNYQRILSKYMTRYYVKPGVTGWAQVHGLRGATETPNKMDERLKNDIYYINNWSFGLDMLIIAKTIGSMIRGDKNAY